MKPLDYKSLEAMHESAMRWLDVAMARERVRDGRARRALLIAARLDWFVARQLPPDFEPSRSILSRSAATLFGRAGDREMQGRAAAYGLYGQPPKEVADELREQHWQSMMGRKRTCSTGLGVCPSCGDAVGPCSCESRAQCPVRRCRGCRKWCAATEADLAAVWTASR